MFGDVVGQGRGEYKKVSRPASSREPRWEPGPRTRRLAARIVAVAAVVAGATNVRAQPAAAQAEQLFRDGKRLMGEGNIAAACDAFDASYRKAPAITTLLNLADCREKNQQYASAWGYFIEAARQARTDPGSASYFEAAQRRAGDVEKRLSYLIILVPDEAKVDGLTISRNGVVVDAIEWNRDIPVDGGEYRIEGKAPGYEAWSVTVKVGNAKDKESVNVPRFREARTAAPANVAPIEPADHRPSMFTGKRKVAVGLWGVAVVGVVGSVGFELAARSTYEDAKLDHDNDRRHDLTATANRQRKYAIASGIVGVIAAGAGIYLWYSGRPSERSVAVAPRIENDLAEIVFVGNF